MSYFSYAAWNLRKFGSFLLNFSKNNHSFCFIYVCSKITAQFQLYWTCLGIILKKEEFRKQGKCSFDHFYVKEWATGTNIWQKNPM